MEGVRTTHVPGTLSDNRLNIACTLHEGCDGSELQLNRSLTWQERDARGQAVLRKMVTL